MVDVRRIIPPYLYLPCDIGAEPGHYEPEMRDVEVGHGLVAYTALDRLRRAWGYEQEWVVVPLPVITELRERLGFTALLLDDGLSEQERSFD